MANKVIGKEIDYRDYPYHSSVGTILELRDTPKTGSVWRLHIESLAREGFEAFETPIRKWFVVPDKMIQQALITVSVGDKVKVYFYNEQDLTVVRIESVEG